MYRLLVLVLAMFVVACGGRQSVLMQESNQTATVDTAKAEALAAEAKALWAERGSLEKANAAIAKWQDAAKADSLLAMAAGSKSDRGWAAAVPAGCLCCCPTRWTARTQPGAPCPRRPGPNTW